MPSGFISWSVHARLQVSVCSSYELFDPGKYQDRHTHAYIRKDIMLNSLYEKLNRAKN